MSEATSTNYIELAADIVSAYVSNNPVPANELSSLIQEVHTALLRVTSGVSVAPVSSEAQKPAIAVKKSLNNDYIIAEAPLAHAVQHVAGRVPRQMGPAAGLSDGCAELCQGALESGEADGARPAAPPRGIVTPSDCRT
jgi:hypothetical protein